MEIYFLSRQQDDAEGKAVDEPVHVGESPFQVRGAKLQRQAFRVRTFKHFV
ncbi:hypothetical protein [Candidatus Hakubella thermalkaliphila]|uniref:hypothetical protein n=1 Tax=Candidatus Hakubella thermalkaliphila TaxID=2754717 RepID=UPI001594AAE4|nr:hypothetical protein [Candidatus Hakubella thermalkaliphila]